MYIILHRSIITLLMSHDIDFTDGGSHNSDLIRNLHTPLTKLTSMPLPGRNRSDAGSIGRSDHVLALHIDGLVQDCSNSIAGALELLLACTKPSIWSLQASNVYYNTKTLNLKYHKISFVNTYLRSWSITLWFYTRRDNVAVPRRLDNWNRWYERTRCREIRGFQFLTRG